ncbi:glycosyltransferase family 2 protein [Sphingomonas cannabina]|uniref:glycosyltransferase family 2 protein n=1 Tax=Sphingomonas cannabina TaxID=2899123 RepID=UPI001F18AAFB|nr:glycosyltransferase family 2 protein [Sphingomonas cannabina]UIJ46162.1 glycosyltransferase family 2 protein [Sphingomonas cannabina]
MARAVRPLGPAEVEEPPLFSVVVPTYNRHATVIEAVESALAQTVRDIEVIVVDDGSSDRTPEALAAIPDPRLHVIVQDNAGASAARNRGITEARGRYVAFLDSDDRFLPEHLADLLPLLAQGDDIVAYSRVIVDRGSGRRFLKPYREIRLGESVDRYLMCERGFIQTSSLALPRGLARTVRYREDVRFGDDTDFAVRLSLHGARFLMAPRATVLWADRQTDNRLSQVRSNIGNLTWLKDLRPHISARAYSAYMGWHAAKSIWPTSRRTALRYYLDALRHGAFRPHVAAIVLLQIIIPDGLYRRTADRWIAFLSRFKGYRI